MKNILNNIYIFSKLSIILVLASILIFTGFLFYRSYTEQSKLKKIEVEKEIIIVDLINNNSDNIEKLNSLIDTLNNSVLKINEKIQVTQNGNNGISKEFQILFDEIKNEIHNLSLKVQNIQKITENTQHNKSQIVKKNSYSKNINEIISLIKLKFENGKNFSEELNVLSALEDAKIIPILEKLYILNNSNFKGNENLLFEFQNETNKYISNVIISNNNIIKPFISFIEVQPSNKKNLNDKSLINIKKINEFILKKEYEKSFVVLKSLNNHNIYFKKTKEQLNIGISFYSILDRKI